MKKDLRPKKLVLKVETLRRLEADQLAAAKGGGESGIWCVTTVTFSEGACETYSWWYACEA
jgi:hypothetical protein